MEEPSTVAAVVGDDSCIRLHMDITHSTVIDLTARTAVDVQQSTLDEFGFGVGVSSAEEALCADTRTNLQTLADNIRDRVDGTAYLRARDIARNMDLSSYQVGTLLGEYGHHMDGITIEDWSKHNYRITVSDTADDEVMQ